MMLFILSNVHFSQDHNPVLFLMKFLLYFPNSNIWFDSAKQHWLYSLSNLYRPFFLFIYIVTKQLPSLAKPVLDLKELIIWVSGEDI